MAPAGRVTVVAAVERRSLPQRPVEELDRPRPGEPGCLEGRHGAVHPLVEPGVVEEERRLDRRHLVEGRRDAVEDHARLVVRARRRDPTDDAATPAEPDDADLPGRVGAAAEVVDRPERVGEGDRRLHLGEPGPRLVLGRRGAADRRHQVGRQRDVARDGRAPGDVPDVRLYTTVLVDDDDAGRLRVPDRAGEVALHRPLRAGVGHRPGPEARVRLRHRLGQRVVGFELRGGSQHNSDRAYAPTPRECEHRRAGRGETCGRPLSRSSPRFPDFPRLFPNGIHNTEGQDPRRPEGHPWHASAGSSATPGNRSCPGNRGKVS